MKQCPRCKTRIIDYPAISRRDGKTLICSECGTSEAIFDLMVHKKKVTKEMIKVEREWLD